MSTIIDAGREAIRDTQASLRQAPSTLARVVRDPRSIVGGAALTPLLVLYGHVFVDAVDGSGFNIILPEVQATFDLSLEVIATLGGVTLIVGVLLSIPIAAASEKTQQRVAYLAGGAFVAAFFSLVAGIAGTIVLFALGRGGFGLGLRLNDPVQQSLLADYYPVATRMTVFSGRELMRRLGTVVGPLLFGGVTYLFGWRAAVIAVAAPCLLLGIWSLRLHNPRRGAPELEAMGIDDSGAEDDPPSFADAYAALSRVGTVRRLWYTLPFLVGGVLTMGVFLPLFAEEVFGMNAGERGVVFSFGEAAAVVGLLFATPLSRRYLNSPNPERIFPLLAVQAVLAAANIVVIAAAPTAAVFVAGLVGLNFFGALITPAFGVLLSLVVPPRVRTIGFAVGALWILPGLLMLPVLGAIGDSYGLRWGLLVAAPMFLIGGLVSGSGGRQFVTDMRAATTTAEARTADRRARSQGAAKLLVCRGVDLSYGQVQALFGVDFDVDEGELVALVGTDGAGKSSLLRAITGAAVPSGGTVLFDGKDITTTSAARTTGLGVVQVPGGKGVVPDMTVAENLRAASWRSPKDPAHLAERVDRVLERFPGLAEHAGQPARNLSRGEQQLLTLAQALVPCPRLLLVDEPSLGLDPGTVEQLLGMVKAIHAEGVTVVLAERSLNVVLAVCERTVFMEKGEVRFEGPTTDLLGRPDILRSASLDAAASSDGHDDATHTAARIDHE